MGIVGTHFLVLPAQNAGERLSDVRVTSFGLGGPLLTAQAASLAFSSDSANPVVRDGDDNSAFAIVGDAAVMSGSNPLSNLIPTSGGLKQYKVRRGDTLASIAAQFNITKDTVRYANPTLGSSLKQGMEVMVLPVTGVLYDVQAADTLDSIASRFQASADLIKQYNPDYQKILSASEGQLILPYAKPVGEMLLVGSGLPDLKNYFSLPARGWNWGILHDVNAVDIANKCGTSVYAAADGLVVDDDTLGDGSDGWNNGYGIFVLVEHPNGVKTRYAHLERATVRVGDTVSQGQEIGLMGNTGNTHGPTGCHVHFEVLGAKNPFALQ